MSEKHKWGKGPGKSEISSQGETPSQGDTEGTAKPGGAEVFFWAHL